MSLHRGAPSWGLCAAPESKACLKPQLTVGMEFWGGRAEMLLAWLWVLSLLPSASGGCDRVPGTLWPQAQPPASSHNALSLPPLLLKGWGWYLLLGQPRGSLPPKGPWACPRAKPGTGGHFRGTLSCTVLSCSWLCFSRASPARKAELRSKERSAPARQGRILPGLACLGKMSAGLAPAWCLRLR